jgi:hypothetical protein
MMKVSRCIAVIKEQSMIDHIRVLLYKVLQYQFYLGSLEEVKHKVKDSEVKKKRGIRDITYALNHLLENLYINNWDLIRLTVNREEIKWRRGCRWVHL